MATAKNQTTTTAKNTPAGTDELTAEVEFHGRTVPVKTPTLEQLTIFRRLADRFARMEHEDINATTALDAYDRALRIITAVIVHPQDKMWLEDLLLDGEVQLVDTLPLLQDAIAKLQQHSDEQTNRTSRRTAAARAARPATRAHR